MICQASVDDTARHAVDNAAFAILCDHDRAFALELLAPACSVVAHARHDHGQHVSCIGFRNGLAEVVHRRAELRLFVGQSNRRSSSFANHFDLFSPGAR